MGGVPLYFIMSLALPSDLDTQWLDQFLDGMDRACHDFNVSLVGGDSSASDRIFVDVAVVGSIEKGHEVRRSGAKPGDGIYVTGPLGGSALGLDRLRGGDVHHPSVQRHLYPTPRHGIGHRIADQAHAMIDISDGLSTDLDHILQESHVSARLYRNLIPSWHGAMDAQIMHGGEEYELLIIWAQLPSESDGIPLTRIGEIIPAGMDPQIYLIDGSHETVLKPRGFQHFNP
jgi:thiamine-monophosphate kinase